MAKYTTELQTILQSDYNISAFELFPIFDEEYRATLVNNIIDEFMFREIAFDSVNVFNIRLLAKLNQIMPRYNKLYESQLLEYNPLLDYDLTETTEGKITAETSGGGLTVFSNTPTEKLTKIDIEDDVYASSTSRDNTATESESGSETNRRVFGKTSQRSYPELIRLYRESLLNIDLMIINDLDELFMQIW